LIYISTAQTQLTYDVAVLTPDIKSIV